jgi:hypothetical protein
MRARALKVFGSACGLALLALSADSRAVAEGVGASRANDLTAAYLFHFSKFV